MVGFPAIRSLLIKVIFMAQRIGPRELELRAMREERDKRAEAARKAWAKATVKPRPTPRKVADKKMTEKG